MKHLGILLFGILALAVGCGTAEKYVRIQASEIDGDFSGGPVNGRLKAKDFLLITAPGAIKGGTEIYDISEKFYPETRLEP